LFQRVSTDSDCQKGKKVHLFMLFKAEISKINFFHPILPGTRWGTRHADPDLHTLWNFGRAYDPSHHHCLGTCSFHCQVLNPPAIRIEPGEYKCAPA
jgi:hypothetical protein